MKGKINQTHRNEVCSIKLPAQAAHHQPSRKYVGHRRLLLLGNVAKQMEKQRSVSQI